MMESAACISGKAETANGSGKWVRMNGVTVHLLCSLATTIL